MIRRAVWIAAFVLGASALAACSKGGGEAKDSPFGTPEASFEQVRKALLNMDAELMWDTLGDRWKDSFEKGRQELQAKPQQEKEDIAKEGMVTAADIDKMDAKSFFKFYFNYRKHETFKTNAPEILEKKGEAIRDAKVSSVEKIGPDKDKATKAVVHFILEGKPQRLDLAKVGDKWLVDVREGGEPKMP